MRIQHIGLGWIVALALGGTVANVAVAQQGQSRPQTIRDLLWVWGNPEMVKPGQHTLATFASASPATRAELLGVPNVVMAGQGIPNDDKQADALTREVSAAPRLVWEIAADGSGGPPFVYTRRMAQVRRLVDKYPQIEGVLLDDMSTVGIDKGFKPEHIRQIRRSLDGKYAAVKVWGVLYTMSFNRPKIDEYINELDVINLWTWHAKDLINLEKNVAHCEKKYPGKPIVVGLYLYDYGIGRRMPMDLLKQQCETALRLARAGRIQGIIFLTINDDPETVGWVADWVKQVGGQKIGSPVALQLPCLGVVGTARTGAPSSESKKDGPMEIRHIIFLIHPCVYEGWDPKHVRDKNSTQFVEREKEVKQKWLKVAETADAGTLLLQLYGPKALHETFKKKMGAARACFVSAEFPAAGQRQQAEYHRRLVEAIRGHMKKHDLTFDPAKTTSEVWGGSFEGCAPGYASAFAEGLGLKIPPKMQFEMTVFDSRFLYGAKRLEVIPIPNSDVEAMLFELYDGTLAAIYQTRLTAQWLDARPITLQLDPTRTQVCTKLGHTVWPPKPWKKGDPAGAVPFTLKTQNIYGDWVRGISISYDDFRKAIAGAVVGSASK